MAERPFQPVPNTPLVADPTGDAIWKRWLQGLQSFLGRAVRGPGSSTDNAVARWDGTSGQFLNNSGVIIDDSNNVSGIVNLTTTGSTILGDAAADTLTINAGTWTIGSNYTATRAAGVLPSGTTNIISQNITYSGDLGGTSDGRGFVNTSSVFGSNPLILAISHRNILISNSTATITSGYAETSLISVESSGNITNAQGFRSSVNLQSSGSVSVFDGFTAPAPVLSSTGTITTINAFRAQNLGNSLVTTAVGFKVDNFTNSTNMRGVQSSLSSGAGKHNLYIDGTADSVHAGNFRLGSTTAPTVALDVTGSALISSNLTVSSLTSGRLLLSGTAGLITGSGTFTYSEDATFAEILSSRSASIEITNTVVNTHATGAAVTYLASDGAGDTYIRYAADLSGLVPSWASGIDTSLDYYVISNTFNLTNTANHVFRMSRSGVQTNTNKIYPGTDAAAAQTAAGIYAGNGAPNNANGSDGDFYMRGDGGVLTTIYQRRAGAWVGVV